MTSAEIIALAKRRGVTLGVFLDKLRVYSEGEPDESLLRLLRDNKQAVMDAILAVETEPERWQRLLAEKIETIVKVRGLTRLDAEREAFRHVVVEFANATHPDTDPRVCALCNKPSLPLTPTLPYGVGERHAWLHQHCHQQWSARRQYEVVATLAGMGIVEPRAADEAQ
jgi:hypothetical protein